MRKADGERRSSGGERCRAKNGSKWLSAAWPFDCCIQHKGIKSCQKSSEAAARDSFALANTCAAVAAQIDGANLLHSCCCEWHRAAPSLRADAT
jgi:hypothetical protein